jgi:hypothetical protein
MKKFILAVTAAFITSGAYVAVAADGAKSGRGMMDMKKSDTNGDGMLSKDEFMKMHEAMFDRMKGVNGMVSMNNMQEHCMGMMGQGGMMGKDHQMPGHMGKGMK